MASFLYCFPYIYRSQHYCDSNSCRSPTLLKTLAKNNGNHIAIAFKARKSDNYRYRYSRESDNLGRQLSKKKQRTDTLKDAKMIKSDNFTRSNIRKMNYWMSP